MRLSTTILATLLVGVTPAVAFTQDAAKPADTQPPAHGERGAHSRRPHARDAASPHHGAEVGKAAPEFTLTGADGKTYTLASFKGKTVVLEWFSPACPVSAGGDHSYWGSGRAAKVVTAMKAADADAVYLTVNSDRDGLNGKSTSQIGADSTAAIVKAGQSVPVLMDADGKVGRAFGAKTTPHVFIIDAKGIVAYIGAPMSDDGATDYITGAVTALKAGKPVEPSRTKNKGCSVKYAPAVSSEAPPAPAT